MKIWLRPCSNEINCFIYYLWSSISNSKSVVFSIGILMAALRFVSTSKEQRRYRVSPHVFKIEDQKSCIFIVLQVILFASDWVCASKANKTRKKVANTVLYHMPKRFHSHRNLYRFIHLHTKYGLSCRTSFGINFSNEPTNNTASTSNSCTRNIKCRRMPARHCVWKVWSSHRTNKYDKQSRLVLWHRMSTPMHVSWFRFVCSFRFLALLTFAVRFLFCCVCIFCCCFRHFKNVLNCGIEIKAVCAYEKGCKISKCEYHTIVLLGFFIWPAFLAHSNFILCKGFSYLPNTIWK